MDYKVSIMARQCTSYQLACAIALCLGFAGCGIANIGDSPDDDPMADASVPDAPVGNDAPVQDTKPVVPCVEGNAQTLVNGTCYMFFSKLVPWDGDTGAQKECEVLGAHLATSTSVDENKILLALVADPVTVQDVWMGANDIAVEDSWDQWITGEPLDRAGFRTGEPNNNDTVNGGEDCIVMEVDNDGTWDDRNCTAKLYGYFCERE